MQSSDNTALLSMCCNCRRYTKKTDFVTALTGSAKILKIPRKATPKEALAFIKYNQK